MSTWSSFSNEKQYTDKWRTFLEEGYKKTVAYCDAEDEEYETSGNLEDFDVDACGHPTNIKSQDIETYQHMVGGKSISHPGPGLPPAPAPEPTGAPAPSEPEAFGARYNNFNPDTSEWLLGNIRSTDGTELARAYWLDSNAIEWVRDRSLLFDGVNVDIEALEIYDREGNRIDPRDYLPPTPTEEPSEPETPEQPEEDEGEERDEDEPVLSSEKNTAAVIHFVGYDEEPLESIHYPSNKAWDDATDDAQFQWMVYYRGSVEMDEETPLYKSWYDHQNRVLKINREARPPWPTAFRNWLAWEIENPEKTPEVKAWCGKKECTPADIESKREPLKELYILEESQMRRWQQLAGINTRVL